MPTSFAHFRSELKPLLVSPPQPLADSQFHQLARCLFAAQFESIQPYRNLCLARGLTPSSILHWTRIPAIPTVAFNEFDWTSLHPKDRSRVFLSSGTSRNAPSRHFHDASSLDLYECSIRAWAPTWLFPTARQRLDLLFLTPGPPQAPHSSLVHMFETLRCEWGTANSQFLGGCDSAGLWTVSPDLARQALKKNETTLRPVALLGTAFSFVQLLDQLAATQTQFVLPPGSRILETGGYKGRSRALAKTELYRQLTATLGIPATAIISEYGMCELSSQAYDHAAGSPEPEPARTFRFPPWTRAIVIDPHTNSPAAPGETGLLRVFDLANVRSVMAIQTEDLARQHNNGFVLLGRATAAEARGCSLSSR